MICHDLDKGTMVNHDLARFTMIMARVPWLRTLGKHQTCFGDVSNYLMKVKEIDKQINIKNEPLISTLNEQFVIKPAAAQE